MQHIMPHYSPTMWDHTLNAEKWLLHPMFHRQQPTSCFKKTSDAPWWFIASSQSSDGLSLAHLITHIDLFEGWALQAMPNSKQSATTWNFECKKLNHTHTLWCMPFESPFIHFIESSSTYVWKYLQFVPLWQGGSTSWKLTHTNTHATANACMP